MIGCLIVGGLTAFAVTRMIAHRRWCGGPFGWHHRHHHGWHGGGWHGRGQGHGYDRFYGGGDGPGDDLGEAWPDDRDGGGGRGWGRRWLFRRVAAHVRATPEQERRMADAVNEFRDEMKKTANGEGDKTRHELADALRRPTFDGVAMGEQFARHDTVLEGARKAF